MKEYKVVSSYDNRLLEEDINEFAAKGYEVCKLSNGGDDGFFLTVIMERDIEKVCGNNEK